LAILVAIGLFARRALRLVRIIRAGKPTARFDDVPARARAEAAERERSLVAAHAPPPSASIASIAYRRPPAA